MFNSLPAKAQKYLSRLSTAMGSARPSESKTWSFNTDELALESDSSPLADDIKSWAARDQQFLYYFKLSESADLNAIKRAYADAKASSDRAFARLLEPSECFYVGSSQKIARRVEEHLGYGGKGTFAMQLAHWAPSLRIKLEFVCAKYPTSVSYGTVQALEDVLWDELKPMFGRKGRK
jgi:hypothetical protein